MNGTWEKEKISTGKETAKDCKRIIKIVRKLIKIILSGKPIRRRNGCEKDDDVVHLMKDTTEIAALHQVFIVIFKVSKSVMSFFLST